jgi:hypothetical protein
MSHSPMSMRRILLSLSGAWEKTRAKGRRSRNAMRRSSRQRFRCFEALESRELLAAGDWLGTDWQYRSAITIPSAGVSGTSPLADFPLLIDSTHDSWRGTASGGRVVHANGNDFAFTLADGQTRLDYEIEAYDSTTGHLTAWVRVPELTPQQDTTIYAYYGNAVPGASQASGELWMDYASVYHFSEDTVSAAALCGAQACDSTANGNHLFGAGMLARDSVAGKAGNALSFAREGTGLDAMNFFVTGNEITLSTWLRAETVSHAGVAVSLPYSAEKGWDGFDIYATRSTLDANLATDAGFHSVSAPVNYADGSYHHVAAVYDGASVSIYFDGQLADVKPHSGTPRLDSHMLTVGYASQYWSSYRFNGQLDEVRVADVARSADWLQTEYANQVSANTFSRVGSEEFNIAEWSTRIRVDINNTGHDAALHGYQVMVDVPYRQGMRSDFADIRFTDRDETTLLDHWLEESVSASRSRFWLQVPELPAGQETFVYLYYGNLSASSASDGLSTFFFFDDFNDGKIATNEWALGGHPEEYNGTLVLKDQNEYVQTQQPIPPGYALRHRSWHQEAGRTFVGFQENIQTGAGNFLGVSRRSSNEGGGVQSITQDRTGFAQDKFSQLYSNEWHTWETEWITDRAVHRIVDTGETLTHTSHVATDPVKLAASVAAGGKLLVDWLLVRQFVQAEPVVALGLEQPNPAAPPPIVADAGEWTQALPDSPGATDRWQPRDSAGELVFDGAMWILGGWTNTDGRLNDVWKSTDGVTWQMVTAAAPWAERNTPGVAVHEGKMWISGGASSAGTSHSDLWSSTDGVNWTLATDNAPWGPRSAHTMLSFQGKLYVTGGMDVATGTHYTDVWSSVDGVAWARAADNAFPARSMHTSVVYDDKMWVVGGGVYDTTRVFNTAVDYNDAWFSSDGETWTAATSAAPWKQRRFACSVVHRDYIWLIAGAHFGNRNDVWVTQNGKDWTEVQEPTVFSDRHEPSCLSFQGSLWVMGGFDDVRVRNDVWIHP